MRGIREQPGQPLVACAFEHPGHEGRAEVVGVCAELESQEALHEAVVAVGLHPATAHGLAELGVVTDQAGADAVHDVIHVARHGGRQRLELWGDCGLLGAADRSQQRLGIAEAGLQVA